MPVKIEASPIIPAPVDLTPEVETPAPVPSAPVSSSPLVQIIVNVQSDVSITICERVLITL
jgi:hypothetical protein